MRREATASVYLGDRRVGTLGYRQGSTWFDYEDLSPEHPVLGQGFERDPRRRRTASGSVPEWFAGLLPEPGSGLRELVAASLGKKRIHDFVLLCHAGKDLPGAVQVVPDAPLDDVPEHAGREERRPDHALRFSFAGVQPKFSMRYEGKALVLPATGDGGDWMVKLPDQRFREVPANEFAMLRWAAQAGIDVPETRLETAGCLQNIPPGLVNPGDRVLAVRRFDRVGDVRVHQEDFAQVREVASEAKYDRASYEGIGRVIASLCPEEDVVEYVRRLVAMVVMGNADAHLKNWTLRYPDTRTARLSPAYDLVCVTAYPEPDPKLAFPLGGTTRSEAITAESFRSLAAALDLSAQTVVSTVRETAQKLASSWPAVRRGTPVPEFVATAVEERLRSLPLMR
ncbi:type II toxin-antitoxin system HipA family toxin [Streptomyces sp. JJ66]|uniref:type II toxin-antitoxin system HipA family toxin n=1 Tax=Streptomyces sp. JJ66 TaxID=2803843 RepID=UPI001C55B147|nr:type II toxin-antitoxin system HipA family toxin [Streptomyces sp. JJ66]MBW1604390.1 type II toxin-antitoxin system HipA family toxin [Streptomyces sp. JJ66]